MKTHYPISRERVGDVTFVWCACGALSDPRETAQEVNSWVCPYEAADFKAQQNRRRWQDMTRQAVAS